METLHATCVTIDGRGVLLCGPPGTGKSDLALRLIDAGALLVADDLVALRAAGDQVIAGFPEAPSHLKGVIEVRGLGLVRVPYQAEGRVALCIHLSPIGEVARRAGEGMPQHHSPSPSIPTGMDASLSHRGEEIVERMPYDTADIIAGIEIPSLTLNGFEASAPAKIRAALLRERVEA